LWDFWRQLHRVFQRIIWYWQFSDFSMEFGELMKHGNNLKLIIISTKHLVDWLSILYFHSMSSAGAIVFAYLGEFLTTRNRSRSIMIASIIFGIISTAFPVTAYFVINQNWKLTIGFLSLEYKPWRLFVLLCGVPSLICGIAMIFLPESPKFCFSKVRFIYPFRQHFL